MEKTVFRKAVAVLAALAAVGIIWIFTNLVSAPLARALSLGLYEWLILNSTLAVALAAFCYGEHHRLELFRNRRVVWRCLQRCRRLDRSIWTMLQAVRSAIAPASPDIQGAYLKEIQEIWDCRTDVNRMLGAFSVPLGHTQTASSRRLADQCLAVLEELNARTERLYRYAFGG